MLHKKQKLSQKSTKSQKQYFDKQDVLRLKMKSHRHIPNATILLWGPNIAR